MSDICVCCFLLLLCMVMSLTLHGCCCSAVSLAPPFQNLIFSRFCIGFAFLSFLCAIWKRVDHAQHFVQTVTSKLIVVELYKYINICKYMKFEMCSSALCCEANSVKIHKCTVHGIVGYIILVQL